MMKVTQITIKGVQTVEEAIQKFHNDYCKWTPIVGHYAPKDVVDLMNKINYTSIVIKKRGKYKGSNHEYIFNVVYSYGR